MVTGHRTKNQCIDRIVKQRCFCPSSHMAFSQIRFPPARKSSQGGDFGCVLQSILAADQIKPNATDSQGYLPLSDLRTSPRTRKQRAAVWRDAFLGRAASIRATRLWDSKTGHGSRGISTTSWWICFVWQASKLFTLKILDGGLEISGRLQAHY